MTMMIAPLTRAVLLGLLLLSFSNNASIQAQAKSTSDSARSQEPPAAYGFTSGRRASRIPFELSKNFVLLQVRVNNSRPLWFMLDTGASASVIDARSAKELGLRVQGKEKGTATGVAIEAEMIPGVSFTLPGVKVFNQTVATLPLDALSMVMGQAIDGIIGYDFINQFVVEVVYEARTINLYAPAGYRYSGSGEILPIKLINKKPFIDARITMEERDAVEGTFEIDTGADGVLVVQRSFVDAHQLLNSVKGLRPGNIGGVGGGTSRTLQGRVRNIQVGRFVINNSLVTFSQAAVGTEARADRDGSLGGEVFRRFKLILDYSRRRIIFEPNKHLTELVEEDMSGFELMAEGENFKTLVINEVLPDSPAAEAGLQEEDELRAINGRPVSESGLERIRQMLKQEGKEYLLSIKRGDQTLQVKIKLRRLI